MCVSEGFWIGDAERRGSFEEVTDEAQRTGQRKFGRWWYRAAEPNFPPPLSSGGGTVDRGSDGSSGGGSFCFLATTSTEE